MEILITIMLVLLLVALVFLGYKLLRFMFKSKGHAMVSLSLCGIVLLIMGVNNVFFKKMHFIPSKVYPDLYLVKYPIKDKKELNAAIKEYVIEQVNKSNESVSTLKAASNYSLRFYQYSKSWGINLFADAGTAYFLENEEDPSGFVVEELSMYSNYRLAEFHWNPCENGSGQYCGELIYFDKGEVSKTEILWEMVPVKSNSRSKK
ncbi:hypothetical protein F8C76_06655 [Flagellimonas olearia]|uniref:Uncharacterized protein n=1 Tax=Flagellimonas olearia TaxID=552546 RepID=A0A6I1E5J5_9FLAO|nr:hypothetical protein [Allomuricauda olearia]KAB7531170.1 hypothetical protein F8C76_06655 [Allomuricauda olearia]